MIRKALDGFLAQGCGEIHGCLHWMENASDMHIIYKKGNLKDYELKIKGPDSPTCQAFMYLSLM